MNTRARLQIARRLDAWIGQSTRLVRSAALVDRVVFALALDAINGDTGTDGATVDHCFAAAGNATTNTLIVGAVGQNASAGGGARVVVETAVVHFGDRAQAINAVALQTDVVLCRAAGIRRAAVGNHIDLALVVDTTGDTTWIVRAVVGGLTAVTGHGNFGALVVDTERFHARRLGQRFTWIVGRAAEGIVNTGGVAAMNLGVADSNLTCIECKRTLVIAVAAPLIPTVHAVGAHAHIDCAHLAIIALGGLGAAPALFAEDIAARHIALHDGLLLRIQCAGIAVVGQPHHAQSVLAHLARVLAVRRQHTYLRSVAPAKGLHAKNGGRSKVDGTIELHAETATGLRGRERKHACRRLGVASRATAAATDALTGSTKVGVGHAE